MPATIIRRNPTLLPGSNVTPFSYALLTAARCPSTARSRLCFAAALPEPLLCTERQHSRVIDHACISTCMLNSRADNPAARDNHTLILACHIAGHVAYPLYPSSIYYHLSTIRQDGGNSCAQYRSSQRMIVPSAPSICDA